MNKNVVSGSAKSSRKSIFFLLIVFAIYALYLYADMATSENVVVKQEASRGTVHILLVLLIFSLTVYRLWVENGRVTNYSSVETPMLTLAIWMAIVDVAVGSSLWSIAVRVGLVVLWTLTAYFGTNYVISDNRFKLLLIIELLIWIYTIVNALTAYANFADYKGETQDLVLNISYNVLVLLPIMLLQRNKIIRFTTVIASCLFIVISLKRGAMISMALMILAYFYVSGKIKKNSNAFWKILIFGIFAIGAFILVDRYTGGYLASRFSAEELRTGSNRDILREMAWSDIKSRGIISLLIGKGSSGILRILESGAHNEFLDILFSYGIIGVIIYIILLIDIIRKTFSLVRHRSKAAPLYAMCVVYILFVGFFGSALYAHYTFHVMLAMGVVVNYDRKLIEL